MSKSMSKSMYQHKSCNSKNRTRACKLTASLTLALLANTSQAAKPAFISDGYAPGDSQSKWQLGASIAAFTNPYIGESSDAAVIPDLRYNGKYVFIKHGTVNLSLLNPGLMDTRGFSVGITLGGKSSMLWDKDNYDDNKQLAGITERDNTLNAGLYAKHHSALGQMTLTVLDEISGKHDGFSADLNYVFDYGVMLGDKRLHLNPFIGVAFASNDEVHHFYGVSTAEATSDRLAYQGKSSTDYYAGMKVRYDITEHVDASFGLGAAKLGKGSSNSSIVAEDTLGFSVIGMTYNF